MAFEPVDEEADAGDAGRSRRRNLIECIGVNPPDRQNGHARGLHDAGETVEPEQGRTTAFAGGRKHCSGDQIVHGSSGACTGNIVHRPANQKSGWSDPASGLGGHRVAPEVHAVGAACDRHVEAVFHDDAGA